MAEFAIAVTIFFLVLMALVDFGRAVFAYNGVSEAAREIARTTSVHPGAQTLGTSPETAQTVATQLRLVPGMAATPTFACVDLSGTAYGSGHQCLSGVDFVQVTVAASWTPATPLLGLIGPLNLTSSSTIRLS